MRILVFETNLMWSARLSQSLRGLGHEALVLSAIPSEAPVADAAIVNLGDGIPPGDPIPPGDLIAKLHSWGIPVIAHAGHKEKELHDLGRRAGADRLATNSELTYKLPSLLEEVAALTQGATRHA